jgi:type IV secretory pathway TraG/TraD family ATPase VirD4
MLFVCDEYQAFATSGENEPSGDEKFVNLARQAKCIPIVATQSISSLRSTLPGESWRTLLQGLRAKVFLTLSDDFSAQMAADLCGKTERLTQLLRQGDAQVFNKKYSQMKLQMKREAHLKLNRSANEVGVLRQVG